MLFYLLLIINMVLLGLYITHEIKHKFKHYGLSIAIRVITLSMFGLVIFKQFSEKQHLIIVLLIWVVFEGLEHYRKPKVNSET